jgi:uncharacterized protein (UPF0332 family)
MDARQYLAFAKALAARVQNSDYLVGNGEPDCRSIVSRAYYAAFHVAIDLLLSIGLKVTDSGECHIAVQHALNNSQDADLVTAAVQLGTLYTERKAADYRLSDPRTENINQASAMATLAGSCSRMLDTCKTACQGDVQRCSVIQTTILAWAKQAGQERKIWKRP